MNKNNLITVGLMIVVFVVGGYTIVYGNKKSEHNSQPGNNPNQEIKDDNKDNQPDAAPTVDSKSQLNITVPEGATEYEITSGEVSYVAMKRFFAKPNEEVVGVGKKVEGLGWFNKDSREGFVSVVIDPSTFKTGEAQRDSEVLKMLGDNKTIGFSAQINLSPESISGGEFSADISGELTINGITKDVVFTTKGKISDSSLSADGITQNAKMSDFGITPPSLLNVSTVDDAITFKFKISAKKVEKDQ